MTDETHMSAHMTGLLNTIKSIASMQPISVNIQKPTTVNGTTIEARPILIDEAAFGTELIRVLSANGFALRCTDRGELCLMHNAGYVPPVRRVAIDWTKNESWWDEQKRIQEGGATESAEVTEERSQS